MEFIINESTEPYFNLASEQFLLEAEGDFFMLWRNASSVIIGKNQNAFAEVNITYAEEKGIKVVRRLTGGGAVFHDLGNVNFTFVTDAKGADINFSAYAEPIIEALSKMGVSAHLSGRNDICAGEYKISGNAQCVYNTSDGRARLLHHGTLLFSADISALTGALKVSKEKLKAKGVESVSSRVCNILDLQGYRGPRNVEGFLNELSDAFGVSRAFSEAEKAEINKLAKEKFSKWDWNFGKSLSYSFSNMRRFDYGQVEISFDSAGGVIKNIEITGDFFGTDDVKKLCAALSGKRLKSEELSDALSECHKYIMGAKAEDIVNLILNKE